jgi:hypothetical protein
MNFVVKYYKTQTIFKKKQKNMQINIIYIIFFSISKHKLSVNLKQS